MLRRTGFRRPEFVRQSPSAPRPVRAVAKTRISVLPLSQPKTEQHRNRRLLDLARGMPCLLRVPGVCQGGTDTTVAAHSNWSIHGKAGGRKADDHYSAWGCMACHGWLDQGPAPRARKEGVFMAAHLLQVLEWRAIAGDMGNPIADRKAALWALELLGATAVGNENMTAAPGLHNINHVTGRMMMNTQHDDRNDKTSGQIIWDTIQDLHHQGQVATRELLAELTGLRMSIIDDHVSRMIENGRLRRLKAGVFAPMSAMPEPRAVSFTDLPDGTTIMELGEIVIHLWPRERRDMAKRLVGDAVQYSNIQAGHDAGVLAVEMASQMMMIKREMGARINDLERLLAGLTAVAVPSPQLDLLGAMD